MIIEKQGERYTRVAMFGPSDGNGLLTEIDDRINKILGRIYCSSENKFKKITSHVLDDKISIGEVDLLYLDEC